MLHRLDSRISALLGSCWYEESSFSVQTKFSELSVIVDKPNPNLNDLLNICNTFFANSTDCFSLGTEQNIVIHKIPTRHNAVECTIEPYWVESMPVGCMEPAGFRYSGIYYKNAVGGAWRSTFCRTTGEMVLLLCKDFISESSSKTRLIELVSGFYADKLALKRQQEERERLQKEIERSKRKQELIDMLITNNSNFQNWFIEFKNARFLYGDLWPCRHVILEAIDKLLPT
jgi:hypothetical protein